MTAIKTQILNLLSSSKEPVCFEDFFDLDFKSDDIFQTLEQLKEEKVIKTLPGEMAYIVLVK